MPRWMGLCATALLLTPGGVAAQTVMAAPTGGKVVTPGAAASLRPVAPRRPHVAPSKVPPPHIVTETDEEFRREQRRVDDALHICGC